jgi:hypothetical protein
MDWTGGTYYEAWMVQTTSGTPMLYTWSPENIPGKEHCTCLPTNNISYLPEFLSLARSTTDGKIHEINSEQAVEWSVRDEILTNDTYEVFLSVKDSRIPLRTVWIDPMTSNDTTVEISDYTHFNPNRPDVSEFVPNSECLRVKCGGGDDGQGEGESHSTFHKRYRLNM